MTRVSPSFNLGRIAFYSFLILVTALSVFPFYWMYIIGSNVTAAINQFPPAMIPGGRFIENLIKVYENVNFNKALMNSFFVSATLTAGVLVFCSLAGFAFAKLNFTGRHMLFAFLVGSMMVPTQLGLIPSYMIISKLGWLDDLRAVIIPGIANAFGIFWMRQYISSSVPNELLEAGRIDGCSTFRLFCSIVVPAIRPGFATLGIITFMGSWNDFLWPLVVLKDRSVHTVQIALKNLNGAYYQDFSMILAGTVLATLPILVIFLLFSKQFISGLTEGAVK